MTTVKVADKKPLVTKLLLLEGHTRAGKFLLGNILDGFNGIEHYQYASRLEQISYLTMFGLVPDDVAKYLLRVTVDESAYDLHVGRNLNFRASDKSSLLNSFDTGQYLERMFTESRNGDIACVFKNGTRYSTYIAHE